MSGCGVGVPSCCLEPGCTRGTRPHDLPEPTPPAPLQGPSDKMAPGAWAGGVRSDSSPTEHVCLAEASLAPCFPGSRAPPGALQQPFVWAHRFCCSILVWGRGCKCVCMMVRTGAGVLTFVWKPRGNVSVVRPHPTKSKPGIQLLKNGPPRPSLVSEPHRRQEGRAPGRTPRL